MDYQMSSVPNMGEELYDVMDWEPVGLNLLPERVLTPNKTGPGSTAAPQRQSPFRRRRWLQPGFPQRDWKFILSGADETDAGDRMDTDEPGPDHPEVMQIESPPVTPRKRVIEEVEDPEMPEFQYSASPETRHPVCHVQDLPMDGSPMDVSMEDVADSPGLVLPIPANTVSITRAIQAATALDVYGVEALGHGLDLSHLNWFELREAEEILTRWHEPLGELRSRSGFRGETTVEMEDVCLQEQAHQFGARGPTGPMGNIVGEVMPGSWPLTPPPSPHKVATPDSPHADTPTWPLPDNTTLMTGGIITSSQHMEAGLVPSEPRDTPMTSLGDNVMSASESRGQERQIWLRLICGWPRTVMGRCGEWALQHGVRVVQSVKRRAIGICQPPEGTRTANRARRVADLNRSRRVSRLTPEQQRAHRLRKSRMERRKVEAQQLPSVSHAFQPTTTQLLSPARDQFVVQPTTPRRIRVESKPVKKASIRRTRRHPPGSDILPGRVTKQRKAKPDLSRPAGDRPWNARVTSRPRLPSKIHIVFDKKTGATPSMANIRRANQVNLDFAQAVLQQKRLTIPPTGTETEVHTPEHSAKSSPMPGAAADAESDALPAPRSPQLPRPSSPEPTTAAAPEPPTDFYAGVTQGPDPSRSQRRVRWQHSDSPLGRPIAEIRVYNPEEPPVRSSLGAVGSNEQQSSRAMTDDQPEIAGAGAGSFIKPLSGKWDSRLDAAMNLPNASQVGTSITGDPLTRKDIATCITPLAWLNDEIINAYVAIILDNARRSVSSGTDTHAEQNQTPSYHAFNSFFYSSLRDRGYESVRRWASRAKIGGRALLDVETVLVPVHHLSHWTLLVVKPKARTIEYFDSLAGSPRPHIARIRSWLRGELRELFREEEWKALPTRSPMQDNGSDCGVFLLTTAKLVALNQPLSYGAKDIPLIRKRIVAEILNGGFVGEFDPTLEFPLTAQSKL
ncbi:Smt3-specific protease [Myotisia sp. PD_48]|nr:Smt3-specific protease [Myotisia sp. PD_48]